MRLIKIIKLIRQTMQAKRNSASSSSLFNNKTNNLIQPLISISKASTPLRTRIIGSNNSQINSTPINFNKVAIMQNKSPSNKENLSNNHIKLQPSKNLTILGEQQNRINLSPVISLNRKLIQGPKFIQKQSHTPQSHKFIQDYEMNMVNSGQQNKDKRLQTLTSSNSSWNNFNSTTNFSNLRQSNSFKNLIEGRCKTPNRDSPASTLFPMRKQSTPLLKQSSSPNFFSKNFQNQQNKFQSNLKMIQSKSYDKIKTFSSISSDTNEIKCMNNDGKKAKYRVINNEENDSDQKCEMQLYYCSKCTIPLVQQGFMVQQIGKQSFKEQVNQNQKYLNDIRQKLQNKKKGLYFGLNEISSKEQQEVRQLNIYYNKIFQYLQSQRQKDLNAVTQYYIQKKQTSMNYVKEIDMKIAQLENKFVPINQIYNDSRLTSLINIDTNQLYGESKFEINSTTFFNKFKDLFENYLRLTQQGSTKTKNHQISNRNHAMRFSFQKILNNKNTPKGQNQKFPTCMNALKEIDQEYLDEDSCGKQNNAFRDLFPADQQDSDDINNEMTSPTFKKI